MLKTNPLLLELLYYQTPEDISWPLTLKKLKKDKNFQKTTIKSFQKLVHFCVFVFVVPKQIAHKMVITNNFVSQKTFIDF